MPFPLATVFLAASLGQCSKGPLRSRGPWATGRPQPHILFIIMDDLGWHDVGFRSGGIATPEIDKLAAEGTVLNNYYVLSTCAPTRAAFLTGRHATHTGFYLPYAGNLPFGLKTRVTLPRMLRQAGYVTHAVGKWHLGFARRDMTPTFKGFDSFYGYYGWGQDYFSHREHYPLTRESWEPLTDWGFDFRRDEKTHCGRECSVVERPASGNYSTELFTRRAVHLVQAHDTSKPLFLYLAHQAVHAPPGCPNGYDHDAVYPKVEGASLPQGCIGAAPVTEAECGRRNPVFCGMLRAADRGIGEVLSALKDKDMLADTVVVFTTDNGGPVDAPDHNGDAVGASNWPLRGGKHTLFEGGVRATGVVWSGERAPAVRKGARHDGIMHAIDWFPTLLGLANAGRTPKIVPSEVVDGTDQWASIALGQPSPHKHLLIAAQNWGPTGEGDGAWALRKDNWKIIVGPPAMDNEPFGWSEENGAMFAKAAQGQPAYPHYGQSTILLFDVEADMKEEHELSDQNPEKVRELLEILEPMRKTAVPWHHAFSRTSTSPSWVPGLRRKLGSHRSGWAPELFQISDHLFVPMGVPVDGVWEPWLTRN